jgi:hypothetical protein
MSGPVLHRCAVPTVAGVPTRMAVAELAITASMKARAYSIFPLQPRKTGSGGSVWCAWSVKKGALRATRKSRHCIREH